MGPKLIVRGSVLLLLSVCRDGEDKETFCAKHIKVLFWHTGEIFDVSPGLK